MDDQSHPLLALLDALPLPALLVRAGHVVARSAAAAELLGDAADPAPDWLATVEALADGGAVDVLLACGDGPARRVEVRIGPPIAADGGCVVLLRDVGDAAAARWRLERGIEFERLLTRGSALLMRSGDGELDAAIETVLGTTGSFCGVDRAYVFRFDEAAGTQSNTHEWVAPGISREAANLQDIPLDAFPWLLERLRGDHVVCHASLDTLPVEAHTERAEFEREGIRAILIVPLWSADRLRGFVGFDAVNARIDWEDACVVGLRLLAQMLAGALDARATSAMLRHRAMHDALTGLPNRLYLRERFGSAAAMPAGLAVAVVDVDDFKRVNDRHGHAGGDALLCELGRRLQSAVAGDAVVARLGGDEFVVIEPACDDGLARRLLSATAPPFALPAGPCRAGISAGLARADGAQTLDALLERADAAMYRAKAAGKNRWAACASAEAAVG